MIGSDSYQFVVCDQGGSPQIFHIEGIVTATINRPRDDIGTLSMVISAPTPNCCANLAEARTVRYEMVVLRNGDRIFEGPITRLSFGKDTIEIDAADVVWYLSRTGLATTLDYTGKSVNAIDILYTTLKNHFPEATDRFNIGKYVTKINCADDARTAAKHPTYSKTLFELLDNYAENGGIDYTVIGRQIIIFDVHCKAHVLQKFGDSDFNASLRVVEYGSQLRTRSIVTRNDGVYTPKVAPDEWVDFYGQIDNVISSIDESAEDAAVVAVSMESQAEHDLSSGYPAPIEVLVPQNAALMPCAPVEYADLVPGAWLPVESDLTCRRVMQWMRLDAVRTTLDENGEKVFVSLSQAPSVSFPPTAVVM